MTRQTASISAIGENPVKSQFCPQRDRVLQFRGGFGTRKSRCGVSNAPLVSFSIAFVPARLVSSIERRADNLRGHASRLGGTFLQGRPAGE